MPTIAPPDTHEVNPPCPDEELPRAPYRERPGESPRRPAPEPVRRAAPATRAEPVDEEELDDDIFCHLSVDGKNLCGTGGLAWPLTAYSNPKASPCEGGCGCRRCPRCAALV
jgi:hypothetical protein